MVVVLIVVVVCCVSSYLISHPLLVQYLTSHIKNHALLQTWLNKTNTKNKSATTILKGLSLRQVLSLDNEDDDHMESIGDNFNKLYQISDAIRTAGLEHSNVIIGIDFSASNEWQGRKSFKCNHQTYQRVDHITSG